jgi:predicted Co/Zn/Cd cation transporter (cation efflux family)
LHRTVAPCDTVAVGDNQGHRVTVSGRVVWTFVAVMAMFAAGRLTLPGVNRVELAHVISHGSQLSWGAMSMLSVVALGLGPLITSFVLVEVVALAVPRLRRLRHNPEGRRKLGIAVAATAILVACVQAYFIALYLEALDRGGAEIVASHMRPLITVTLVGGTMFLVWLVSVINRRGIGNGYAVLMVAGWLMSPNWKGLGEHSALVFALTALAIACVVAIVVVLTRTRVASTDGAPIPLPSSGLVPLSDLGGIALAVKQLLALGLFLPIGLLTLIGTAERLIVVAVVILILSTVLWSWVFTRPALRRDLLVRAGYAAPDLRTWLRATVLSTIGVTAIFILMFVTRRHVPELGVLADPVVLAFITATLLDVIDEARDRRQSPLVAVWPLHDPILAAVVRDNLRAAQIPHHLQASRLRSLLWFFGPYVPIMVLVPEEHAVVADQRLRELLADPR